MIYLDTIASISAKKWCRIDDGNIVGVDVFALIALSSYAFVDREHFEPLQ